MQSDPDLLEQTATLYNQLIQRYTLLTTQAQGIALCEEDRTELTRMCDQLLGHLLENFGDCACTQADVQAVWRHRVSDPDQPQRDITVQDLASLLPGVLPVALMRSIIGVHRIPIIWHVLTHRVALVQRYRHVLPEVA